jgi:hypothetical protein
MATTLPVAAKPESGFKRFIDEVGNFFVHTAPIVEEEAVAAEPFLALTPFGPEYNLVVGAIVGIQKVATVSLSTGAALSGVQRMALVMSAVLPGLEAILKSKGITEPAAVSAASSQFAQNVYNFQTGPVALLPPPAAAAPAPQAAAATSGAVPARPVAV